MTKRFSSIALHLSAIIVGVHVSIVPDRDAFVLFTPNQGTNQSKTLIYLQNGCPSSNDQSVVSSESGKRHFLSLQSIRNLECAITVKIASTIIPLDRPYVDVVAIADIGTLSYLRQTICISTQLSLASLITTPTSCTISVFDSLRHSCIIRTMVPFSWFPSQKAHLKQVYYCFLFSITLSYSVGSDCSSSTSITSHRTELYLTTLLPNRYQTIELDKQDFFPTRALTAFSVEICRQLSIRTRSNISFSPDLMTTLLAHLKYNDKDAHLTAIQIRVWLDNRLEIVSAASSDPTMWSIRVESSDQAEAYTTFTCYFIGDDYVKTWDGNILMILVKMHSQKSMPNAFSPQDDKNEAAMHWALQYIMDQNSTHTDKTATKRITTRFKILVDAPYVLVPLMKDTNLINTAILSGRQTSMPMRILTISEGGLLTDVTSNSHCISAESRVLKTSPTCSSVYVDGSEMRGMAKIKIHVHYEAWTTSVELTVWYPKLPITVWISDPVLNAIKEWQIAVWKWLPQGRRKKEARQFGCTNKFQQAEVRILAAFQVGDERTGERLYLSGQRDTLFDVTAISLDNVHSSNLGVVTINRREGRILLNALQPGSARITVRSNTPNIDYGSAPVVVTEDAVSVRKITADVVAGIEMSIMKAAEKPYEFLVNSQIQNTITHRYQHALLVCRIHYSDDQIGELADVSIEDYMLSVWSGDERLLAIIQQQNKNNLVELVGLDDTRNAVINIQLKSPPHCVDPDSNSIASREMLVHLQFDNGKTTTKNIIHSESLSCVYDEKSKLNFSGETNSTRTTSMDSSGWHLEIIIGVLILIGAVIVALHAFGYRARRPLSQGYEKLVLPIITRLSSSGSCGKDENSHEWVWLSKAQIDSDSIKSRYSQKSTIDMVDHHSTSSVDTRRSVSYRGSEISVFISPQPALSVNNDTMARHTTSWRDKPKVRMARNAMIDSSSEHNLSRYTNGSVMLARSEGEMRESWRDPTDSRRHYPCRRQESWRNSTRSSQWSGSGPMPEYLSGLRESVA
ncbi:unnamed protein product [Anisakis simplex]|uniref:TMEM132 domain-containing protein n=1 Tax=Anisakis simplex TaxID=6269 RepID=A0A0M3JYK5_ANISI|nr:unnamed protein product [Anisakis simplex]